MSYQLPLCHRQLWIRFTSNNEYKLQRGTNAQTDGTCEQLYCVQTSFVLTCSVLRYPWHLHDIQPTHLKIHTNNVEKCNFYKFSFQIDYFQANQLMLLKQMNARSKTFDGLKRNLSHGAMVFFLSPNLDMFLLFLNAERMWIQCRFLKIFFTVINFSSIYKMIIWSKNNVKNYRDFKFLNQWS